MAERWYNLPSGRAVLLDDDGSEPTQEEILCFELYGAAIREVAKPDGTYDGQAAAALGQQMLDNLQKLPPDEQVAELARILGQPAPPRNQN